MIRISINWDFISPILRVMSGTLVIEDVSVASPNSTTKPLIHCTIKKEQGSTEYKAIEGIDMPTRLWEELVNQVDIMLHSYFAGMTLAKDQYSWVDDSANMSLENWLKMKGIRGDDKGTVIYEHHQSDGFKKIKTRKNIK